ncbi:MAG: putative addiction module antidote protein [Bdellovibrionales bacterium]|nr:putative addiction module antidote protein [Bdellovibrionales bacterium]
MKTEDYRIGLLERLKDKEYAIGFLTEVLTHETQEAFLIALKDVIDARQENITELSEQAGVTRQALYNALSENGNPTFSTITDVLGALGLQFSITEVS